MTITEKRSTLKQLCKVLRSSFLAFFFFNLLALGLFFFLLLIMFCVLLALYIPTLLQFPLYPLHLEVVMHLIVSKKKKQ